jgi:hypothetical protein
VKHVAYVTTARGAEGERCLELLGTADVTY